ncbi:hypothetical protein [Nannocystis punicea]|uniref:Uncharacterized protein n=1 Tax=Nannocystis punicea TaxID=2995304 RepID=A0ABY7H1V1_9BACT|nr:hypothetical protein [Nannocystis poenicansa]WAS93172.1 hypothetical protein O0S08_43975 [Nannocystis poenicansa]
MDRKTKTWLIVLGVVTYGVWTAGLLVGEGPLRSVLGVLAPVLVGAMGILFFVGISAATQKQWDRLRAEGTQVTALVKGYHKARVLFEIQLPGGSIGKELYPSYVGGINRQFLVDACATGRPLEVLYLADSPRILIKDPATGKFT